MFITSGNWRGKDCDEDHSNGRSFSHSEEVRSARCCLAPTRANTRGTSRVLMPRQVRGKEEEERRREGFRVPSLSTSVFPYTCPRAHLDRGG